MSFLYPLGLLGLIGIPVLIVIYIIKNKYTEQVISSTYLWTLSERFLKKRLPINKLVGIISLILQILAVLLISVAVAHPVFTVPNAANVYCFVLDGSGSMNMTQNGTTRFDLAKEEIASVINGSMEGSEYSLVLVGGTSEIIFDGVSDKERALVLLDNVSVTYSAADYTDAIGKAQEFFNENPSVLTYLVTDREVEDSQNVTVIRVGTDTQNFGIAVNSYAAENGNFLVEGAVTSNSDGAVVTVQLSAEFYDGTEGGFRTFSDEQQLSVTEGENVFTFVLESEDFAFTLGDFISLKAVLSEEDCLVLDNEAIVYNVSYENSYDVLLVSDSPFYVYAALLSVGNARTTVVSTDKYTDGIDGYDLYIYDSYSPKTLPDDGAVWFFNPTESVANAGFTVQDEIALTVGAPAAYSTSSATLVKTLLANVIKQDVYVKQYQKCGFYLNFTTLMTCEGNPVVFTGVNSYGNREVVFTFNLSNSNLPALIDYNILLKNLLSYSFPSVIENASYYCGDTMLVNVVSNCDSIRIDTPLGKISYLDMTSAVCEVELEEVGTYTITLMSGDTARTFHVYSALPEEERAPVAQLQSFAITGEAGKDKIDGIYDDLLILFIILALVYVADWMVYCYEQYQLR